MTELRRLLYWSGPGILIRGGKRVSDATFERPGVNAVVIRWGEVLGVESVDPWPAIRIDALSWRTHLCETLTSRNGRDRDDFAQHVEQFLKEIRLRTPGAFRGGWLDRSDVEWEPARRMPGEHVHEAGHGFYRTGQRIDPKVIAWRPGTKLAVSRGRLPHEIRYSEVAVTEKHLYARYSRRRVFRIGLQHLSNRTEEFDRRSVRYIFGRRASLVLSSMPRCPVMDVLNGALRGQT